MTASSVIIRVLGQEAYQTSWDQMRAFTQSRNEASPDEIWLLEHAPVFTQGQNGKAEHVLNPGNIPIIKTDRGGQVTYHGPGQLMVYVLIDLKRKGFNVRQLVTLLEQSVIDFLANHHIQAIAKQDAPGVYVNNKKICSIGLRIRKGCSYHGIAFNIGMNLEPFNRINPCGFKGLQMTELIELIPALFDGNQKAPITTQTVMNIGRVFADYLIKQLGYTNATLMAPLK